VWPTPRAGPRADVHLAVRYHSAQGVVVASARKISGGASSSTPRPPLAVNQDVLLQFSLPGVAEPCELQGLVVWSNPFASQTLFPTGMGIKFLKLSPHQKKTLDAFVQAKLAEAPSGA